MNQPIWALDRNGKLFAYCNFIRKLYWYEGIPERTNLCAIFQSTLWGTIALMLSFPALILGWLMARLFRWVLSMDNEVCYYLNDNTFLGKFYGDAEEAFTQTPVGAGWVYSIITCFLIAAASVITLILASVVSNVGSILSTVAWGFLWFGYGIYQICAGIGWLELKSIAGIMFLWREFIANPSFWWTVFEWAVTILKWFTIAAAGGVCVAALFWVGYKVVQKTGMHSIIFNGYRAKVSERRERREKDRQARTEVKRDPWYCSRCTYTNSASQSTCPICGKLPPWASWLSKFILDPVTYVFYKFGKTRKIQVKDATVHVLGPIRFLGMALWSMKNRICPLVLVVDQKDLERMHTEFLDGAKELPGIPEILVYQGVITKKQLDNALKSNVFDSPEAYLLLREEITERELQKAKDLQEYIKQHR